MEPIQTTRLLLRDFEQADWTAVHEYSSDPEVVRFMEWGPNNEEDDKGFVKRAIAGQKEDPRKNFTLAIVLRTEDALIGGCNIQVSSPDSREGSIGYCLNRDSWGRGYATEVASALVAFGFERLGLHRISATCNPENLASAHVLEKVGMKREGHIREHRWAKGRWRDSYLYSILDWEWKRSNADKTG